MPMRSKLIYLVFLIFVNCIYSSCQRKIIQSSNTKNTFYIDQNNGDDKNNGSINAPFSSVKKGLQSMEPGDTLLVKNGTYKEEFSYNIPSGILNYPIVIKAYPNHQPVFQSVSGGHVFVFSKITDVLFQSYIVLDSLIIDGSPSKGVGVKIKKGAHHITVKNCEIKNTTSQGILITALCNNNLIDACHIHHGGTTKFDHGIYITGSHNTVSNCNINNFIGRGVLVYTSALPRASYNIIEHNTVTDNGAGTNRQAIHISSGTKNIVRYNTVSGNVFGIYIDNTTECEVYNNTIINNDKYGLYFGPKSSDCMAKDNVIKDNGLKSIVNESSKNLKLKDNIVKERTKSN